MKRYLHQALSAMLAWSRYIAAKSTRAFPALAHRRKRTCFCAEGVRGTHSSHGTSNTSKQAGHSCSQDGQGAKHQLQRLARAVGLAAAAAALNRPHAEAAAARRAGPGADGPATPVWHAAQMQQRAAGWPLLRWHPRRTHTHTACTVAVLYVETFFLAPHSDSSGQPYNYSHGLLLNAIKTRQVSRYNITASCTLLGKQTCALNMHCVACSQP